MLIDRVREHIAAGKPQNSVAKYPWARKDLPAPVTKEELLKAEETIGFELPGLFKALYSKIANGGFGPGYGLLPLFTRRNGRNTTGGAIDLYARWREADLENEIDVVEEDERISQPKFSWPAMLIPLNDRGCAIRSCVDCSKADLPISRSDPGKSLTNCFKEAPSLKKWLLDSLEGKRMF